MKFIGLLNLLHKTVGEAINFEILNCDHCVMESSFATRCRQVSLSLMHFFSSVTQFYASKVFSTSSGAWVSLCRVVVISACRVLSSQALCESRPNRATPGNSTKGPRQSSSLLMCCRLVRFLHLAPEQFTPDEHGPGCFVNRCLTTEYLLQP